MSPLPIDDRLTLPAEDLSIRAVRSRGPGGQNVNKVSSKVELRFDLAKSRAISDELRARVRTLFAGRLDGEGKLLITSQLTRDQIRNREDALEKLRKMVLVALTVHRPRVATKPKKAAKARRVDDKRRTGAKKALRSRPRSSDA
jgi:ribosome-associated protein